MIAPRARLALLLIAIASFTGLTCQAALGFWSEVVEGAGGAGAAAAATVSPGAAPVASEAGAEELLVKWASAGAGRSAAEGYVVHRYDEETGLQAEVGPGCAGTITALSCTELEVPPGSWEYTVVPLVGANWRGPESVKSGAVSSGPGTIALATTLFGGTVAPLPAVVVGSVSGFAPEEAIEYLLDGAVPLVGSPAQVQADGSAAISLTLPAEIGDGPHSIAVRGAGTRVSTSILVDDTAPTATALVTPAPDAGGTNTTPVEVAASGNDGTGSGIAIGKYSEDGSDPRSSPTAVEISGPIAIATTTTLRFYFADNAGNESAVESLEVKIEEASAEPVAAPVARSAPAGPEGPVPPPDEPAPESSPAPPSDEVGPEAGSVTPIGLGEGDPVDSASLNLSLALDPGVDADSGLAGGAQLLRAGAALAPEAGCEAFGPYIQVGGADPATPFDDTVPSDLACYRYDYVVADRAGNRTSYFSPAIRVDTTPTGG